jgi:cell division control protein 45
VFKDSGPNCTMYLPRNLISHLYLQLLRTYHTTSPPVLILTALEPDALCACRILIALLKRDYIRHQVYPVTGYSDLTDAGEKLIRPMRTTEGGEGGIVICLGVGGLIDLEGFLGFEADEQGEGGMGGVEFWILDSRRPYNLANVFGGNVVPTTDSAGEAIRTEIGVQKGRLSSNYKPGSGGVIVFDDGDIEECMDAEREAYCALAEMPDVGDDEDDDIDDTDAGSDEDENEIAEQEPPTSGQVSRKRKSWSDQEDESGTDEEDGRPLQRRRSNSVCHDGVKDRLLLTS